MASFIGPLTEAIDFDQKSLFRRFRCSEELARENRLLTGQKKSLQLQLHSTQPSGSESGSSGPMRSGDGTCPPSCLRLTIISRSIVARQGMSRTFLLAFGAWLTGAAGRVSQQGVLTARLFGGSSQTAHAMPSRSPALLFFPRPSPRFLYASAPSATSQPTRPWKATCLRMRDML